MSSISRSTRLSSHTVDPGVKVRYTVRCACDLLYQEMECCLRFVILYTSSEGFGCDFQCTYWNFTFNHIGMGVEPNHVHWLHTDRKSHVMLIMFLISISHNNVCISEN